MESREDGCSLACVWEIRKRRHRAGAGATKLGPHMLSKQSHPRLSQRHGAYFKIKIPASSLTMHPGGEFCQDVLLDISHLICRIVIALEEKKGYMS